MKRVVVEPPKQRSDSWKVVAALSDNVTWHVIHLEYADSGRTGKFYRIFMPDVPDVDAFCQWGARPSGGDSFHAGRGQHNAVSQRKARELLVEKRNKGYTVVFEGETSAPKNSTSAALNDSFFRRSRFDSSVAFAPTGIPLWHGWR